MQTSCSKKWFNEKSTLGDNMLRSSQQQCKHLVRIMQFIEQLTHHLIAIHASSDTHVKKQTQKKTNTRDRTSRRVHLSGNHSPDSGSAQTGLFEAHRHGLQIFSTRTWTANFAMDRHVRMLTHFTAKCWCRHFAIKCRHVVILWSVRAFTCVCQR